MRRGDSSLTRIAEDELAGLDRPLARERLAAALDRRLIDAVLVAQRIAVARLGAEPFRDQDADSLEAVVLLPGDLESALVLFLGIAECAHAEMDLTFAERCIPTLRIVDAFIAELPGARRHPLAERLGKALQRIGEHRRFRPER